MKWLLMYLAIAQGTYNTETGLHTTGPFTTQFECEAYAEEIWTSTEWAQEPDIQNFYDSKSLIKHREHKDTNMGVFYVCVKAREPSATILEKLIDVTSGGNIPGSSGQFLTYPQHDALRQKK